jgi:hypothetical protein
MTVQNWNVRRGLTAAGIGAALYVLLLVTNWNRRFTAAYDIVVFCLCYAAIGLALFWLFGRRK